MVDPGVNAKLLQALPDARRVLEVGCPDPRLAEAYRAAHPQSQWTTVLPDAGGSPLEGEYDLVVLNDTLGSLAQPVAALLALEPHLSDEARLVCAVANASHAQVAAQLLMGDLTYQPGALLDSARPRLLSQGSAYKLLLDAGWVPAFADAYAAPLGNDPVSRLLVEGARLMGAPLDTATRNLGVMQYIFTARRWTERAAAGDAKISVVVPINRPLQHHLNIEASPGLREIGAEVVPIVGARSAGEALEQGRARAKGDWLIFCHQDVYFCAEAARAISAALSRSAAPELRDQLIGFIGLERDAAGSTRYVGMVVDRLQPSDHPASDDAVSMDELGVIMHRDSPHRIDPAMGWHLWATELVLAGWAREQRLPARIIRAPVFHNSLTDLNLPQDFGASARYLRAKYPAAGRIDSLCCFIE